MKRLASGALAGALLMAGALAALPSTAGAAGHHTKPGSFTATETLANTAVVLSWTVPASNGSARSPTRWRPARDAPAWPACRPDPRAAS